MKRTLFILTSVSALVCSVPSYAELKVQFVEGAPKDRFIVENTGACALPAAKLTIDFTTTEAGLFFDVTKDGAGVEVFQPFEVSTGAEMLVDQPMISDGDQRATLDMAELGPNQSIAFTIDVDDSKGTRAITVAGSEINGTTLWLNAGANTYDAVMDSSATAVVETPACGT